MFSKVVTKTDFDGNITQFKIDSAKGLITEIDQPAVTAGKPVTTYTYNANGQLLTRTDPLGRVDAYTYDSFGNRTAATIDNGRLALTTKYGYDAFGNLTSVTDPAGNATTYSFDATRRCTAMVPPAPAGSAGSLTDFTTYDADGRVTGTAHSTGNSNAPNQWTTYTYTPTGKVATLTDASADKTTYAYDANDRLISATDAAGRITSYGYDADDRVTLVCKGTGTLNWQSACGGISQVAKTIYSQNGLVSYRGSNQSTTATPSWQYVYYVRDGFDRLSVLRQAGGSQETTFYSANDDITGYVSRAGQTTNWTYDALHRRVTRSGSFSANYTYDLAGKLLSTSVGTAADGVPAGT